MTIDIKQAVPWAQMEVPENIPHPQTVMMIGFFEFGDISVHKITFWISCAMILLGVIMVYRTRNDVAKNLLMIQIFFEIGAFPIIKTMTAALTCTSMDKWAYTRQGALRSCQLGGYDMVEPGSQCMDEAPNVLCWEDEHLLLYVAPVMVFLAPYYSACIHLQSKSQAKQSIVIIDQVCGIVSFQFKFILAFIASSVGDCYPWVMVASIEVSVVFQLILTTYDRDYTSVLTLNAVRVGGLAMASINGFYAVFVVYHFGDTPGASTGSCVYSLGKPNFTALPDFTADDSCMHNDQLMGLNGVCDVESGWCSPKVDCTDCDSCPDVPAQSYGIFFGLIAANAVAVIFAVWWFRKKKVGWIATGEIKKTSTDVLQVDYPILKRRLEMVQEKLNDSSGHAHMWSSYDRFKLGFDRGQLYAQLQAVWEWADVDGRGMMDFDELNMLCKEASKGYGPKVTMDNIYSVFNIDADVGKNVAVSEEHFFAVIEPAEPMFGADEIGVDGKPRQEYCSSRGRDNCACYSASSAGGKSPKIPLRPHRENVILWLGSKPGHVAVKRTGICEACEMQAWYMSLKSTIALVPVKIAPDSKREKKLVEILSKEVEESIKYASLHVTNLVQEAPPPIMTQEAAYATQHAAHAMGRVLGGPLGGLSMGKISPAAASAKHPEPDQTDTTEKLTREMLKSGAYKSSIHVSKLVEYTDEDKKTEYEKEVAEIFQTAAGLTVHSVQLRIMPKDSDKTSWALVGFKTAAEVAVLKSMNLYLK